MDRIAHRSHTISRTIFVTRARGLIIYNAGTRPEIKTKTNLIRACMCVCMYVCTHFTRLIRTRHKHVDCVNSRTSVSSFSGPGGSSQQLPIYTYTRICYNKFVLYIYMYTRTQSLPPPQLVTVSICCRRVFILASRFENRTGAGSCLNPLPVHHFYVYE